MDIERQYAEYLEEKNQFEQQKRKDMIFMQPESVSLTIILIFLLHFQV